jgi:hypothetical protein
MKYLIFTFLVSISYLSFSQSKTETIDHKIDSKVFNEERSISVFLPDAYFGEDTTHNFTVAYLFDGQFEPYFTMVSSIMSYYEQTEEGVPMIIVGIHTDKRWEEFVPTSKDEISDKIEGADQLTQFLSSEVIPLIDSKYRTKDFKVGVGHSLGGTYVVNEIIKQNSIFDAVIAVSPNLTMYDEQILQDAEFFFNESPKNRRFIYTSAGTEGSMEQYFQHSLSNLDSIVRKVNLQHMYWRYDLLQKANHMTTFVQSFDIGYRELSSKLTLLDDQLIAMSEDSTTNIAESLNHFYSELSIFSQEKHSVNANVVMENGIALDQYGKHKDRIVLCQYALELLEKEGLSSKEKKKMTERLEKQLLWSEFQLKIKEAEKLGSEKRYEEASNVYLKAFEMGVKNGTHVVRMGAVPVLSQAGKTEDAFEQLELLANYFELGGNSFFINNEHCKPLHDDKRWAKLMAKLEKNAEKYR